VQNRFEFLEPSFQASSRGAKEEGSARRLKETLGHFGNSKPEILQQLAQKLERVI
jgi:hypothetical protein